MSILTTPLLFVALLIACPKVVVKIVSYYENRKGLERFIDDYEETVFLKQIEDSDDSSADPGSNGTLKLEELA